MTTILSLLLALTCLVHVSAAEDKPYITVASTTSTENSGLFDHILPLFTKESGIEVRVVAVGTGQAIRLAERGDCDVLLVHHRASEEKFVKEGFGVARHDVMYNDFVIVGPKDDPAGVRGTKSAPDAMKKIASAEQAFASRGDDSGTHKKEQELWKEAEIDVDEASGGWYRATGSGMGATLNTAAELGAYTLADRGTWLSFKNRKDLVIVSEGDSRLHNPYGVILVNPKRHPHVKQAEGQRFIDWLLSDRGRAAIAGFKVDGQPLFFPTPRVIRQHGEKDEPPEKEKQKEAESR